MAIKTLEELETEIAEQQSRLVAHNQRQIERIQGERKRSRLGLKVALFIVLALAFLTLILWMVLQRTNIYIALGAVSIPGLTG